MRFPPRLTTMVQCNEVAFDANQIAKAFSGVAPLVAATIQVHRSSVFR
jgi:hypothetical protein